MDKSNPLYYTVFKPKTPQVRLSVVIGNIFILFYLLTLIYTHMQCKKCEAQLSDESKFCQKCGTKTEQEKENKNVPWHQKIKWWGFLIISLIAWIIYYPDGGYLWNFMFLIGFIFSLVQFTKEDYFKLNAKSSASRKLLKTLVAIGYIFIFFMLVALISYMAGQ